MHRRIYSCCHIHVYLHINVVPQANNMFVCKFPYAYTSMFMFVMCMNVFLCIHVYVYIYVVKHASMQTNKQTDKQTTMHVIIFK